MNLDMTIFHQAFFEEAGDLLAEFEDHLLHLEERPEDTELLNSIFRCAHSIKGGSATFGFTDIAHFTHSLETLLDRLRNGQIRVDTLLTRLLLESLDHMRILLAVARGEASSAPDATLLIARIHAAISGENRAEASASCAVPQPTPATQPAGERRYLLHFVPGRDVLRFGNDLVQMMRQLHDQCKIVSTTCIATNLPPLSEFDPEACYLQWDIELIAQAGRENILEVFEFIADESEIVLTGFGVDADAASVAEAEANAAESSALTEAAPAPVAKNEANLRPDTPVAPLPMQNAGKAESHTLRVSTDKVDKLINLVGELVINQSMLNAVVQDFSMEKLPRLVEAVAEMERASRELQERVMAVRMLPIKHAFGRFPRLVRDLAEVCGKRIELKMSGEETELDKTVIEAMADPLTHLVRNSVDHGLEPPAERRAAGKPEVGTVALHAYHEGGNIVIEVSDDGRGLNRERILKKAIDRGLISESDTLSEEAICNLIFHPGFSTAEQVTDLSGRGVGMDIVKQAVQGLGGSIGVTTTAGQGTRFRIRLPLTMAILEGLSLSVGHEVYVLPLTSIVESIRPRSGEARKIAGQAEVVLVRGEVLPVLRLYQVFGAEPFITDPTQGLLVIVENDGNKVALLVDELIGQSQVVIKSLETNYRKVDGIAGATILGDGRVALILDVPGLLRGSFAGGSAYAAAA